MNDIRNELMHDRYRLVCGNRKSQGEIFSQNRSHKKSMEMKLKEITSYNDDHDDHDDFDIEIINEVAKSGFSDDELNEKSLMEFYSEMEEMNNMAEDNEIKLRPLGDVYQDFMVGDEMARESEIGIALTDNADIFRVNSESLFDNSHFNTCVENPYPQEMWVNEFQDYEDQNYEKVEHFSSEDVNAVSEMITQEEFNSFMIALREFSGSDIPFWEDETIMSQFSLMIVDGKLEQEHAASEEADYFFNQYLKPLVDSFLEMKTRA